MASIKPPNKYNSYLFDEISNRKYASGSELAVLLKEKFNVTEGYARKLIQRSVDAGYVKSSDPLIFVKGQFLYFPTHLPLDLITIKRISQTLRPPMYRLIELLDLNNGIVSYYEALKVTSSPEEKSSTKVNTLDELLTPLRRLNFLYEKKDSNDMEFIILKINKEILPAEQENTMMSSQYQKNVLDSMVLPDILSWLRKCNIIDNLRAIYRNKSVPSIGAKHNNILWDAFAYTKTTGINDTTAILADSVKKQTLVALDVVLSRSYNQIDLDGFLSRVQININSAKSKRKILPIIIYKDIEDSVLNKAKKLGFIAFDIGSIFGRNIYRVVDNLYSINLNLDKLTSGDTIEETLEILETSGQEEALKQLRGALFEALLYPLIKRLYPNAEIYPGKILYQKDEEGAKLSHEYDYLIKSSQPKEIVLIELKGYSSKATIDLGTYEEKGTLKYFFNNAVPFAKTKFREEISEGKRLTASFITSGNYWADGLEYLTDLNEGRLKPSELNLHYNGTELLSLLEKYNFEHEVKTIKKYFMKS